MRKFFGLLAVLAVAAVVLTRMDVPSSPISWFFGQKPEKDQKPEPEMDRILIRDTSTQSKVGTK